MRETLKQISQRALSWIAKPSLEGMWVEAEGDRVWLRGKLDGQKEVEGAMTVNQARALRTLLDLEIHKAEGSLDFKKFNGEDV